MEERVLEAEERRGVRRGQQTAVESDEKKKFARSSSIHSIRSANSPPRSRSFLCFQFWGLEDDAASLLLLLRVKDRFDRVVENVLQVRFRLR